MKKLLLLTASLVFSVGAWADCGDPASFAEEIGCLTTEASALKKQLNKTYAKLYAQVEAKQELENAQKAWLRYRDLQCGDFTLAEAGANSSQMAFDAACQISLLKSRIDYLSKITTPD